MKRRGEFLIERDRDANMAKVIHAIEAVVKPDRKSPVWNDYLVKQALEAIERMQHG